MLRDSASPINGLGLWDVTARFNRIVQHAARGMNAEGTRVPDGTMHVDRVPMDDRCGDEAKAGRAKALVFKRTIGNFT